MFYRTVQQAQQTAPLSPQSINFPSLDGERQKILFTPGEGSVLEPLSTKRIPSKRVRPPVVPIQKISISCLGERLHGILGQAVPALSRRYAYTATAEHQLRTRDIAEASRSQAREWRRICFEVVAVPSQTACLQRIHDVDSTRYSQQVTRSRRTRAKMHDSINDAFLCSKVIKYPRRQAISFGRFEDEEPGDSHAARRETKIYALITGCFGCLPVAGIAPAFAVEFHGIQSPPFVDCDGYEPTRSKERDNAVAQNSKVIVQLDDKLPEPRRSSEIAPPATPKPQFHRLQIQPERRSK